MATEKHLGKLIGNTGNPACAIASAHAIRLSLVVARFVRIPHTEREGERGDGLSRTDRQHLRATTCFFSASELGEGVEDCNILRDLGVSG